MIVVINYDTGNLRSVVNALSRLGCECTVSSDPVVIAEAERVILPGVGHAAAAMKAIRTSGLADTILALTQPVLGICIGLQLMCRHSEEGMTECLGIFDTDVRRFDGSGGLKVPHTGWNTVENMISPLFSDIPDKAYFYYVHSYAPAVCADTIATTCYGGNFSAAIAKNNFFGTQFHPEKSGRIGEQVIKNFLEL